MFSQSSSLGGREGGREGVLDFEKTVVYTGLTPTKTVMHSYCIDNGASLLSLAVH